MEYIVTVEGNDNFIGEEERVREMSCWGRHIPSPNSGYGFQYRKYRRRTIACAEKQKGRTLASILGGYHRKSRL